MPPDLTDGIRLRRSILAVPGSSERMLAKAKSEPADEVFVDLEDSVAPSAKNEQTRALVVQALLDPSWIVPTRALRVNAIGTPWFIDDVVQVVTGAGSALHGLVLPKVESAADVEFASRLLDHLELANGIKGSLFLEVQIESPRGLMKLEEIAAASPRVEALVFGPGDYAAAAGMPQLRVGSIEPAYPGDQWHHVLASILTVARAFGLHAIDGPYAAFRDKEGFREVATRSRLLGFDGKWAIHPSQVSICNEIYSPTAEEVTRAEAILSSYASATTDEGRGAVLFEAEMIDEASRKMAAGIVLRGRAAGIAP